MAKRKWWQYLLDFLGPLSAINVPIDRKNGTGVFSEGMQQQLGSLVNSKTGAHLTGAQQEANEFSSRMAEEEFARQEEFYLKYQSPKALMQQGVNPFGINGSAGGHSVSGGAPSSVSPSAPQSSNLFDIVQLLFGMQQQKRLNDSQIELNDSAAQRNLSEVNERNINAASLADMNAAEIMLKLSNVELNAENVKLIASKVLNTDQDTALKEQQISKLAAEILNIDADTNVKAEQLNVMLSQIANLNADTDLKRKQFDKLVSDILVNDKQLDVFNAQIALMGTQSGLNRSQAAKVQAEWKKLLQDYNRDEVQNALNNAILSKDATDANFRNPASYTGVNRAVRAFLNEFEDFFSLNLSN